MVWHTPTRGNPKGNNQQPPTHGKSKTVTRLLIIERHKTVQKKMEQTEKRPAHSVRLTFS